MPMDAHSPCRWPGCGRLTRSGYCDHHATVVRQETNRRRGSSTHRGYGYRWQQARRTFLQQHPLCRRCEAQGLTVEATVVDHIEPHGGDRGLMWDRENWQPLCERCHNQKTATVDGGFGRARG